VKTQPIQPASVTSESGADEALLAVTQAQRVFLHGNELPARWAGASRFVVLETGFGEGHNFLATWHSWREDPQRCQHLYFVSVEPHPLRKEDLQRAHAASSLQHLAAELLAVWPPLTPNLHMLDFEGGQVRLLLGFGEAALLLPALRAQADAFYINGAMNGHARVFKAVGRKASAGATLAGGPLGAEAHAALHTAGFEVQRTPTQTTQARFRPRHVVQPLPDASATVDARHALVIGAGLAGAAAAQALARLGLNVTVLERHAAPAREASGNPAGLFHGTVNPDDGPYARLFRTAAIEAQRDFIAKLRQDPSAGSVKGLLRIAPEAGGTAAMQGLLNRLGLPPDYVQALDAASASTLAGVPLQAAAWHYPNAGWIKPARWVQLALDDARITLQCNASAARIDRIGEDWCVFNAQGALISQAPVLVVACTISAPLLLQAWCEMPWPLRATHGQVTHWRSAEPNTLKLPVAGDGYAIALGEHELLCGATRSDADISAMAQTTLVSLHEQATNLERLQRLTGLQAPQDTSRIEGRTGWRLHTDDRLPLAGAMPLRAMPAGQRSDQARLLPRERGLFVLTALGARGVTLAPLLGRLVAAQATGTPWPLEQDLADAVDPARWLVRAVRKPGQVTDKPA
jgi:tRNA 5-methylaminomethyl-2-thiouridine biosynthesis bifunctional protein